MANELLMLAGGDVDLAANASRSSKGLNQAKCMIIDERFKRIEEDVDALYEEE